MYSESPSLGQSARNNFVKKVYSILLLQLSATFFMVYLNYSSKAFARFQLQNTWMFWVSFIVTLGSLVALCTSWST